MAGPQSCCAAPGRGEPEGFADGPKSARPIVQSAAADGLDAPAWCMWWAVAGKLEAGQWRSWWARIHAARLRFSWGPGMVKQTGADGNGCWDDSTVEKMDLSEVSTLALPMAAHSAEN